MSRRVWAFVISVTLFVGWTSPALAQSTSQAKQLIEAREALRLERLRNDSRYKTAMLLCAGGLWELSREYGKLFGDSLLDTWKLAVADVNAWDRAIKYRFVSPQAAVILESEPAHLAFQDCQAGTSTIWFMAGADMLGKAAGTVTGIYLARSITRAFLALSRFGKIGRGLQASLLLGTLGYAMNQAHKVYQLVSAKEEKQKEIDQKYRTEIEKLDPSGSDLRKKTDSLLTDQLNATRDVLAATSDPSTRAQLEQQIRQIEFALAN